MGSVTYNYNAYICENNILQEVKTLNSQYNECAI